MNRTRLNEPDHRALVLWTAECADHVLSFFEEACPEDGRPRHALEVGRAWARGETSTGKARDAAFAAHAAARAADLPAAQAAARAAGHAAATAHVPDHARHAAAYAVAAVSAAAQDRDPDLAAAAERDWQVQHLPKHLFAIVFPS